MMQEKFENHENSTVLKCKRRKLDEDYVEKYHYVWIKNLPALVSKQLSKHKNKKEICDRCLQYFQDKEKFLKHEQDCTNMNKTKVRLPVEEREKTIEFKNFVNKEKMPFVIYADFESYLKAPKEEDPRVMQIQLLCML